MAKDKTVLMALIYSSFKLVLIRVGAHMIVTHFCEVTIGTVNLLGHMAVTMVVARYVVVTTQVWLCE